MEETKKLYHGAMPQVLNEDILSFLCIKHKDEIGKGSYKDFPRPRIRYVIDLSLIHISEPTRPY